MERTANFDWSDIEGNIGTIQNISNSKVITNSEGHIEEIHILANGNRSAKRISRDVQSLLLAKYNIAIDYKKISVAQMDVREVSRRFNRIEIVSFGFKTMDTDVDISVTLKFDELEIECSNKGINSVNNIYRLVVKSTLECVHKYLKRDGIFVVEDIEKIRIAKREAINIGITYISPHEEELLLGAALLKKDDYIAVVKATLDAINRHVEQLLD